MFNRYSQQYQPAMFNPLSFEDYAAVPLLAQQKHDQYVSDLTAQKDAIQGLTWHDEAGKKAIDELNSQIENATSGLINSKKGIYSVNTAQQLGEIRNYKEKSFNPLKQEIEEAALSRKELQDRYDKLVDQGYSSQRAQAAIMAFDKTSRDAYGKDGSVGYNGRILADDPDMQELGLKYAERLSKEETIRQTGFEPTNDGRWMNVETGEVTNGTPKEVMQMVTNYLKTNQEVQRYLDDEAFLAKSVYGVEDTEKYKNDLINNAAYASSNLAFRNTSVKFDMKNMSDSQMFNMAFDKANTNVRTQEVSDNPYYNEEAVNLLINPENVFRVQIYDNNGNVLNDNQVSEIYQNKTGLSKEQADDLVQKIKKSEYLGQSNEDSIGNLINKFIDDNFNTADLSNEQRNAIAMTFKELNIEDSTPRHKKMMKAEADKKLQPLMEQYNASLPEGYPKANNIDEFREIFKNQSEKFKQQEIRTVDKNIETTDIVASELKKGNFSDLLGKKIIIQKGNSPTAIVNGDGQNAYDKLNALMDSDNKPQVGAVTRIATGELSGGRLFKVKTKDGIYTVKTEPLSEGEKDLFVIDQQISEFIQNPVNIGSGEELFSPYLNDDGFEVSMQPKKVYRYGEQQKLVDVRLYTRNEQGQRIRVDNGVEELDINQFIQLNEHQKKEFYKNHFLSNSLQNKSNPYQ